MRKNADEAFSLFPIAFVSPSRGNFTGPVDDAFPEHFLRNAECDLMPVAVAERQKDVDETACRQPSDQCSLFNENGFLNCRCNSGDPTTYDGDVIHLHHDVTYPF